MILPAPPLAYGVVFRTNSNCTHEPHEHVFVGADVCKVRDRRAYTGPRATQPPRPATKGKDGGVRKPPLSRSRAFFGLGDEERESLLAFLLRSL